MALAAEVIHNPENQRKSHAQDDASNNRKVEAAVAALIGDIAGQAAEPKRKPRAEHQQSTGANKHDAYNQQQFSDFAQRVHNAIPNLILARHLDRDFGPSQESQISSRPAKK